MRKQNTWAVILCGGYGSRMGAITKTIPKPLIKIYNQPILWYILMTLKKHGIKNLIFPLGYKGKMLENYIKKNFSADDFNIHCVDTGVNTTIAIRISKIANIIPENVDFLLLNSDTIFDFNIDAMFKLHKREKALITLSSVEIISSWGLIHIRKGSLAAFSRERKVHYLTSKEDTQLKGYIYSGIGIINKNALEYIDLNTCCDFEQDLYTKIINMGRASRYEIEGSWFAIDTPKDLEIFNQLTSDKSNRGKKVQAIKNKLSAPTGNKTR